MEPLLLVEIIWRGLSGHRQMYLSELVSFLHEARCSNWSPPLVQVIDIHGWRLV